MDTRSPLGTVILLHGIGRTSRSMNRLAKALAQADYHVLNIDYPGRKKTVKELVSFVYQQIQTLPSTYPKPLHFVAHSMGNLIIRELLARYDFPAVGYIVMIAPPNQGSEVADFLKNYLLYQHFYGPAGQELTTEKAQTNPFAHLQYPFGVIAGNRNILPLTGLLFSQDHDGLVSVPSTKLKSMQDHITLPCSHAFIMQNQKTITQVLHFLQLGQFNHDYDTH